ncbi:MAG: cytochrome c family protein [Alphaproteobacteria bacterium]|nr:cytochrome c family protein [Alphaproteobacteria bacterium]
MDSFEVNKIVGAVLGTLLFVMGIGFLAEAIYAPKQGPGPGYALPEPEGGAIAERPDAVATPLPVLLANASADEGARVAKKCVSCHNFGEGEGNKTGPHIYDVIGRDIAAVGDFSYSDALHALAAEHGTWTYDALNAFVTNPKSYAPGTKMGFAGLRSETDRADLLAYLQTMSGDPVPFPAVEDMPAADPAAGGETAPEGAAATEGGDAATTH